jgi:hypothetical protein
MAIMETLTILLAQMSVVVVSSWVLCCNACHEAPLSSSVGRAIPLKIKISKFQASFPKNAATNKQYKLC